MNWRSLVKDMPKRAFQELCETYVDGVANFDLNGNDRDFRDIRRHLLQYDVEARAAAEGKRNAAYVYDLEFGLRMYKLFSEHGFGIWQAADNGVWAFISIRIIPDIVFKRLGGFNEERFYKRNWRIWLKDLWWYIYITESDAEGEFDIEASRSLLSDGSQDGMFLLLDHSKGGFRPSVYHELMCQYSQLLKTIEIPDKREDFFRRVLLEHQIKSSVVDPILENEAVYVKSLFDRVLARYAKEDRK